MKCLLLQLFYCPSLLWVNEWINDERQGRLSDRTKVVIFAVWLWLWLPLIQCIWRFGTPDRVVCFIFILQIPWLPNDWILRRFHGSAGFCFPWHKLRTPTKTRPTPHLSLNTPLYVLVVLLLYPWLFLPSGRSIASPVDRPKRSFQKRLCRKHVWRTLYSLNICCCFGVRW